MPPSRDFIEVKLHIDCELLEQLMSKIDLPITQGAHAAYVAGVLAAAFVKMNARELASTVHPPDWCQNDRPITSH